MNPQEILVSIIIPTYNRWKFLLRAIKSCLNQTHPYIEIIIVDDWSSDDTQNIIKKLNNNKIKYLKNATNIWPSASRNKWIDIATWDYINFLDDDDELISDKIEKQLVKFGTSHIKKLWVVTSDIEYNRIDKIWIQHNRYQWFIYRKMLKKYCIYWILSWLIDKKYIKKIWWFDVDLKFNEEYDFYLRLSQYCNFDYIESVWWLVHTSDNQITQDYKERIIGLKKIFKKYKNEYKNQKCYGYNILRFSYLYLKYKLLLFIK